MTFRIAVVCLGNICRSPTAHVILNDRIQRAGLADRVAISSAGTGGWHTGNPMDARSAQVLADAGYDPTGQIAEKFTIDWYAENDLILAMDASNHADMAELAPTVAALGKLRMFRSFDPEAEKSDLDVPDPWFGGSEGFRTVLTMIERTSDQLVDQLPALIDG